MMSVPPTGSLLMTAPRLPRLMALSILAAVVNLVLKGTAYHITGSVGLLADAGESVVNLVAALAALLTVLYAARPADESHTYGHEKIEYFSSGLEGMLILVAACGIAWYAVRRLFVPQELESLDVGSGFTVLATLINLFVARLLLRGARQAHSIVAEADGRHLMADVYTSVGVLVGIGLVWLTKMAWIDTAVALVVAAHISWTGFDLIRRSFDGLMDHALPEGEQAKVRAAIEGLLEPGMDYHALRTRRAGTRRFADFHLLVPGVYTVRRAHELTERIEAAVRAALPEMEVTVHVEPIEERAAWEDSALVPLEQAARQARGEG
jgi:cation diffusion facilitator family transporter